MEITLTSGELLDLLTGAPKGSVLVVTDSYAIQLTDPLTVVLNVGSAGKELALPDATKCKGTTRFVKFITSTQSKVRAFTGQTIDGDAARKNDTQNAVVGIQSDGANWIVLTNSNTSPTT